MRKSAYLTSILAAGLAFSSCLHAADLAERPARGDFGIDISAMDPAARPGDDFFRYVNGHWYDNRAFAADETYVGARSSLIAQRKARVLDIIEAASRSAESSPVSRIVGPFYASFMDQAAIDAAGLRPLAPELRLIDGIRDHAGLFRLFAQAPGLGTASPIEGSVFYDFHAPGWMRYTITPGGLGLPSRELYLDESPAARDMRQAYRDYVASLLRTMEEEAPEAKAAAIVALERALAEVQWPGAEARDFLRTANSLSLAQLQALTPDFDWPAFLQAGGVTGVDTVIVRQPSAMAPLIALIRSTPIETWRAWLRFHLVSDNADYLSAPIAAQHFAFHGRRLSGQEEPAPRWQQGVDLVEGHFGQAVGQLYVERWFPEQRRQMVRDMFDHIRAEMRDRIVHSQWMGDATRAEALRKLDTLVVKIGYPDRWPSYDGLTFDPRDFYGNLRQARASAWRRSTAMIRQPLERDRWMTTPQSSGAAANPNLNEITVPAGALEPPYFDPAADPAVNYGAIGGVLGHELSHMFDQVGRQMDATGALRDWWTPEDAARFRSVAARVEARYGEYEALPGLRVNGAITINENIADISGLTLAYAAYHRSLRGSAPPVIGGFSADQRLFMGWAQMRAGKMRDAALRQQVAIGPHSPDYFRVNGVVRNIDAWYRAFAIGPEDRLYLPPERRAHFW